MLIHSTIKYYNQPSTDLTLTATLFLNTYHNEFVPHYKIYKTISVRAGVGVGIGDLVKYQ